MKKEGKEGGGGGKEGRRKGRGENKISHKEKQLYLQKSLERYEMRDS